MKCRFVYTGNQDERGRFVHRCERCKGESTSRYENPALLKATCSAAPDGPSLAKRARNFARDSIAHASDGFVQVSDEERAARLATCKACPLFNGTICTHTECGCPMSDEKRFFDALAWRSKKCPDGKW